MRQRAWLGEERAMVEARFGRGARKRAWIGIVLVSAVSLVVLPATAPPAHAATCLLEFYWNADGTPGWHPTTIAAGAAPECDASPAIVRSPTGTEIADVGIDGSIWFSWNTDGSPVWQDARVAGPGSAVGNLAMVRVGNGTVIAAHNTTNIGETNFYWNTDGSGSWQFCSIEGPASSDPAMVASSTTAEFSVVDPYTALRVGYQNPNCLGGGAGSTETHANQQLPPFDLGPAMTRWSGGTVMAADSFGALWFLWHFDSDYLNSNWYSSPVGNAVANAGYPAITRFSDGSSIASVAYDGSLWFYWNVDGTPAWGSSRVAAAGSAALSPAIARFRDGTDIAAAGRDGSLWFYWNVDGTPAWNSSEVEGQGSVYDSPAMTRSSSSTEIAVIVR